MNILMTDCRKTRRNANLEEGGNTIQCLASQEKAVMVATIYIYDASRHSHHLSISHTAKNH